MLESVECLEKREKKYKEQIKRAHSETKGLYDKLARADRETKALYDAMEIYKNGRQKDFLICIIRQMPKFLYF